MLMCERGTLFGLLSRSAKGRVGSVSKSYSITRSCMTACVLIRLLGFEGLGLASLLFSLIERAGLAFREHFTVDEDASTFIYASNALL